MGRGTHRRRAAGTVAAVAAAALAFAPAAPAGRGHLTGLPSPLSQLTPSPPLRANGAPLGEVRVPGPLSSRQRVLVGVDETGRPVTVRALQWLTLAATGDYTFAVPAPVTDVQPAPGTDSDPGLRRDTILWQGFSPGRRVLGADATLRVRESAGSLPIRVRIRTAVGGRPLRREDRRSGALAVELTLQNATTTTTSSFTATGVPAELARLLDRLRLTVRRGEPYGVYATTITTRQEPRAVSVEAPFELRGSLRFRAGTVERLEAPGATVRGETVRFSARLGDGAPHRLVVRVRGIAREMPPPELTLVATPVREPRALRPPRGRTWRDAVSAGLVRADGRALLDVAVATLLRLSRLRQYEMFLANPGAVGGAGTDRTVYVYRAAPLRAAAASPASGGDDGSVVTVVAAVLAVLAAAGLVVLWAHS